MYKTDFRFGNPKLQLGQFTTIIDSKNTSIWIIIKISSDFRKNYAQKILMSEMLKLAKLLLFIHATNAAPINFCNEIQQNLFLQKAQLGIGSNTLSISIAEKQSA